MARVVRPSSNSSLKLSQFELFSFHECCFEFCLQHIRVKSHVVYAQKIDFWELANPVRTHKIPSVALWLALWEHVKNPCVVGVQPDEVRRPDGSTAASSPLDLFSTGARIVVNC